MERLKAYNNLMVHTYYRHQIAKLKKNEHEIIKEFIDYNRHLDRDMFVHKVNRMFLLTQNLPKNLALISEILTVIA